MRLPPSWDAERASGWWEIHHLVHTPCGWRTAMPYDLITQEKEVRSIVYSHECPDHG